MTLANSNRGNWDPGTEAELHQPKAGVQVSRRTAMASLPVVRVVQDQSQSTDGEIGVKAGDFFCGVTGQSWETLEGTPLAIREGHIKWPTPFKGGGTGPECWSVDTLRGAPGARFAGRSCSQCEHFLNGCSPNYALVFLLLPERQEILLTLSYGMSRAVSDLIREDTVRARHVILSTRRIRGARGSWYTVEVERDMPALEPALQIEVERRFRAHYLSDVSEGIARNNGPDIGPETGPEKWIEDDGSAASLGSEGALPPRLDVDTTTGEIIDPGSALPFNPIDPNYAPSDDDDDLPF